VSPIRPLQRGDIPQVAKLYELVARDGLSEPPSQLTPFFERTLLDHPWADPEIPSLVWEDGHRITGFIGSNVRRMRFDGRPVRMACSAHLIVHPESRSRAVGAQLMRRFLGGPQQLTITDGATDTVRRMWEGLGGHTVHLSCLSFIRLFRPARLAVGLLAARRGWSAADVGLRPLALAVDRVAELMARRRFVPARPDCDARPLTVAALLEHHSVVAKTVRLYADYDTAYLDWLFREIAEIASWGPLWPSRVGCGRLWAESVHSGGNVVGWYVCQVRRGGLCRVLQFAATPRGADVVYAQLAHSARALGAAGLYGRIEPRLFVPVTEGPGLIVPSGGRLLVHTGDRELLAAVLGGDALLSTMDGEWW
jgi:hypothetical protein